MRANRKSAAEWAIEAVPSLALGGAATFASAMFGPLSGALGVGAAAAAAAWAGLARVGRLEAGAPRFEPIAFPEADVAHALSELLLDEPLLDELLLDQPLAAPSRVVSLFGGAPLPAPGELANRITDFLEGGRHAAPRGDSAPRLADDAGAALHAALADIRRSLA